ncbi:hypothetical protein ATW7_18410 [Alteromonadales bacterium TW-7]|nr:hypothetical protein ATW7_18410 [Alteromonadales bacterium TW-7]
MNLYCIQSSFHSQLLKSILKNSSERSGIAIVKGGANFNTDYYHENNIKLFYIKNSWLFPVFMLARLFSFTFDKIYISDIKSVYYQFLMVGFSSDKIIAYDDGASSISLLDLFLNGKKLPSLNGVETFGRFKILILKLLGVKLKNVDFKFSLFFTIFPFEGDKIINIKINRSTNCISNNQESVVFLGGKYVEVGILSEEMYLRAIWDALARHPKSSFYYIPHRAESSYRVNSVAKLDRRIKIKNINVGVEEYFEEHPRDVPIAFYSLYSTALFTLPLHFSALNCYYRHIDLNQVCVEHRLAVSKTYELLKSTNYAEAY